MHNWKKLTTMLLVVVLSLFIAACSDDPDEDFVGDNIDAADAVSGGLMYDKWWKVAAAGEPTGDHPKWASQSTNTRTGADTWRCKECHAWDYLGTAGAYNSSSSHYTGFTGVYGSATADAQTVFDAIKSGTDHDFGSVLTDDEVLELTKFITEALVDVKTYINYETKAAIGNATNGKTLYENTDTSTGGQCITCHGADGTTIDFHDGEFVGTLANDNPQEILHKIRFGHPATAMPSTYAKGMSTQDAVDILAYAQTLPVTAVDAGVAAANVTTGGLLWDKWWKVTAATDDEPTTDQALWSTQTNNTRSGSTTWRCKECHGWDYKGTDGAYNPSNSHYTGFAGVLTAASDDVNDLYAAIATATDHDFGAVLSDDEVYDLVKFISTALVDMSTYINYTTKASLGDATAGQVLYENTDAAAGGQCISCHGADGTTLNFGDETDPVFVGTVSNDNPWEILHKIRFGHPGSAMPSTVAKGLSDTDASNILAYAQTLTQ